MDQHIEYPIMVVSRLLSRTITFYDVERNHKCESLHWPGIWEKTCIITVPRKCDVFFLNDRWASPTLHLGDIMKVPSHHYYPDNVERAKSCELWMAISAYSGLPKLGRMGEPHF